MILIFIKCILIVHTYFKGIHLDWYKFTLIHATVKADQRVHVLHEVNTIQQKLKSCIHVKEKLK